MIEPIWDDDRLRRAYRQGFGAPAPADLAAATIDRLPVTVRGGQWRGLRPRLAALIAVAIVGAVALSVAGGIRPSPDDLARLTAHGLPIQTVPEALEVRDASADPREIAVRGFLSLAPAGIRCPASLSHSVNPVRLECPDSFGWLLETAGPLEGIRSVLPPGRSGFQPLFPGLDTAPLAQAAAAAGTGPLPEVVLIGHFHDRRGTPNLCDSPEPDACDGFVATGIHSIDGDLLPSSTVIDLEPLSPEPRPEAAWTPQDVDRLVLATIPDLDILARIAFPGHRVFALEPSLGTGALEIIDRPVAWLVNGLDPQPTGPPRLRTLLLVDNAPAEAYEAGSSSNIGFFAIALVAPPVEPSTEPPTIDPSFPTEVFGLPVVSVEEAIAFHHLEGEPPLAPEVEPPYDQELAVRGYFVVPPSDVYCLEDFCPEDGLVWLMSEPEAPWRNVDLRGIWRRPAGPTINLVVGRDVLFPHAITYDEGRDPTVVPLVVVGHFASERERMSTRQRWLFVDALAWSDGEATQAETLNLGVTPTEDRSSVEARIADQAGSPTATWATVMSGATFAETHRNPSIFDEELGRAEIVWRVRRLVIENGFPVVRSAWTADGAGRVWLELWFDYHQLQPTRMVDLGDAVGLDVVDYRDVVIGVEPDGATDPPGVIVVPGSDSHPSVRLSNPGGDLRQLRIAWNGGVCAGRWRLEVSAGARDPVIELRYPDRPCARSGRTYAVVVALSVPVSADDVAVITSFGVGG